MRGEDNFREGLISQEFAERKHSGGLQYNLFSLDTEGNDKEVMALRERIEKFGGVIRIMVHPLFEQGEPNREQHFPRAALTEKGLKTLIEKNPEQSPAMFIFEEWTNLERTQEYLQPIVEQNNQPLYYIPTSEKTPSPVYDKEGKIGSTGRLHHEKWDEIHKKLTQLGVKKAVVGGIIFKTLADETKSINKNFAELRQKKGAEKVPYVLRGCVGRTIEELSKRGLEIELSNFFSDSKDVDGFYTENRLAVAKLENMRSPNTLNNEVK